jgi:glutathione peroxidase
MSFYDFHINTSQGKQLSFSDFEGKVVLIVNTATKCGLTPQFTGLEVLHQQYKDSGLVVLGFPCDQFLKQEPLSNEEMAETCLINHGVTFQLTEKINVNGSTTHPIFQWLKSKQKGLFGKRISWNFTKFLIDKQGNVVKRFSPSTKPEKIEQFIRDYLSRSKN